MHFLRFYTSIWRIWYDTAVLDLNWECNLNSWRLFRCPSTINWIGRHFNCIRNAGNVNEPPPPPFGHNDISNNTQVFNLVCNALKMWYIWWATTSMIDNECSETIVQHTNRNMLTFNRIYCVLALFFLLPHYWHWHVCSLSISRVYSILFNTKRVNWADMSSSSSVDTWHFITYVM